MKRINILLVLIIVFSLTVCFAGCTNQQQVTLYFAVESGTDFYLNPQQVKVTPSPDLYQATLEALIEGPRSGDAFATLPSSTKVNSVEVKDGLAIVDFSKEILTDTSIPHSSTTETLAIYSIVNTLAEFEEIDKVRITIDGLQSGTIEGLYIEDFWGHVGLAGDFIPNQEIILEDEI